tara:strand:- start:1266 stop:1556 length:291 start_codon:yes stop_codon:yes gene_type:complete
MKTALLLLLAGMTINLSSYCQEEPSKNLPPIKMLKKGKIGEAQNFYELHEVVDYKVYDNKGKLISEGTSQWIDYTDYEIGVYWIKYNDQTKRLEKK